ncbi:uncharacterized protein LOC134665592 [Cydia fagiglandana]|uniref:uncharacterized protein LOC134665592 n=1 Tax=Cydia fagiglandana TaxID=1458189 RepID=UPI002FEE391D
MTVFWHADVGKMASSRKRCLRDAELENYLNLNESDLEISDYDDDIFDADFQPPRRDQPSYSSTSSSSEDENELVPPETQMVTASVGNKNVTPAESHISRRSRGNSRTRSCSRARGRERSSRGRGRSQSMSQENHSVVIQDISTNEWTEGEFIPKCIPFTQPAYLPINPEHLFEKYDYLRQYINDSLLQIIVDKSNEMYFARNGRLLNSIVIL